MNWYPLPSVINGLTVIGAHAHPWQYVISHDKCPEYPDRPYTVSAKLFPNIGKRIDIGVFSTLDAAKASCEAHRKNQTQ